MKTGGVGAVGTGWVRGENAVGFVSAMEIRNVSALHIDAKTTESLRRLLPGGPGSKRPVWRIAALRTGRFSLLKACFDMLDGI